MSIPMEALRLALQNFMKSWAVLARVAHSTQRTKPGVPLATEGHFAVFD
jgi:hypothetical protein